MFERQGTISIGDIALGAGQPGRGLGRHGRVERAQLGLVRRRRLQVDGRRAARGSTWACATRASSRRSSSTRATPMWSTSARSVTPSAPNEERGVFLTTDGGRTWTKTLYIDQRARRRRHGHRPVEPEHRLRGDVEVPPHAVDAHARQRKGRPLSIDRRRAHVEEVEERLAKNDRAHRRRGRADRTRTSSTPSRRRRTARSGARTTAARRGATSRSRPTSSRAASTTRTCALTRTNENRVYAVASTLFVSIDGGRTFRAISRAHAHRLSRALDRPAATRAACGRDRTAASPSLTTAASGGSTSTICRSVSSTRYTPTTVSPSTT